MWKWCITSSRNTYFDELFTFFFNFLFPLSNEVDDESAEKVKVLTFPVKANKEQLREQRDKT